MSLMILARHYECIENADKLKIFNGKEVKT